MTGLLDLFKDPYERKARLIPGLLVALPLLVPLMSVYGARHPVLTGVLGLLGGCGAMYALASIARGRGKKLDEMLAKAIELAVDAGQVSISMLQRRLRVGYARAGRLVDEMTLRGITAEAEGPTKPRTVLISREEWRRMQENQE